MRALVQRVARAAVRVEGAEVAAIGPGLLVLLGVTHDDTEAEADRLADKLRALRIFPDRDGRMNEPPATARCCACPSSPSTAMRAGATGPRTSTRRGPSTPSRCTSG